MMKAVPVGMFDSVLFLVSLNWKVRGYINSAELVDLQ